MDDYDEIGRQKELEHARKYPYHGQHGRCPKCGSHSLWDDNHIWGCNDCNFVYIGTC